MTVTTLQGFSELYLRYSSNFQPGFIFCFYNAVFAFGVQQNGSVTHVPTLALFQVLVPYWLWQSTEGVPCAAQEAPAGGLVLYADPRLLLIPPLYIPLPVTTGGLRSRRNSRVAVPYADLKLLLILPLCFPFGNHKFISVCESVSLL